MISLSHISGLVLGSLLGFVMQRGRFCLAGGLRDFYLFRDSQMIIAILIVISIQSVGLFGLQSLGLVILPHAKFLWLATIAGGILFGSGMALAGSCSTGAYYRTAEGLVGSIVAVISFILSSWLVRLPVSKSFFSPITSKALDSGTITQTFHVSPYIIMLILISLTIYLAIRHIRQWKHINVAKITAKKAGISHLLFEARWHPFITAMLVGIIALLAWPASLSAGRIGGLGISGPSAQLFSLLIDGNLKFFDWAGYLLIGLLLGSFVAAKGSQEFRFRNPGLTTMVKSFIGGLFMGIGSGLAGGCMLGNTLVNTAWFSWQGWVFIPCIIFGSWLTSYFTVIRPWQIKS